jgi:CheY-like chemotaxis protein
MSGTPAAAQKPTEPRCVLVIDDDPAIREVVSTILALEGYPVVAAESGVEALKELRGGVRPCLILLDLRMPEMDGWELRALLKREPQLADIPVVVLSGDHDAAKAARSLSANGFLLKPVELTDLLHVVRRYC